MNHHNKISYNIAVLFFRQILLWGINLILVYFLPSGLGDVGLGQFTFATSLMLIFSVLITAGTSTYAIKQIARESEHVGSYIGNMLLLRLLLFVPVLLLVYGLMQWSNYPQETRFVVYIVAVNTCIWTLNDALVAILLGLENMKWQATAEVIGKLFTTVMTVYFIKQGHGVMAYALIVLAASTINLLINAWPFLTVIKPKWQIDMRMMQIIIQGGLPFLITSFFTVAYGQIDTTLLRVLTTDAVVGWYGAATQLLGTLNFFPMILLRAMLPALSRMHLLSPAEMQRTSRKGIEVVILASVPLTFGVGVLAQDIIHALHYPVAFNHSVPLMIILGFVVPITGVLMVVGSIAAATDRQTEWAKMMGIMTVVLIGFDLLFIPLSNHFFNNGAIGAAIGPAISESMMLIVSARILPVGIIDRSLIANIIRTLLCGITMAGVVWVLHLVSVPLVLIILAGALVYGAMVLLMGLVQWRELIALKTQLLQRKSSEATA